MRILSYSINDLHNEQITTFSSSLDPTATQLSFQGKDGFHLFIQSLQKGDVAVFFRLSDVFHQAQVFLMFIRFCTSRGIRLISIEDEIDSADEIFPLPHDSQMLVFLSSLKVTRHSAPDDAAAQIFSSKSMDRMLNRHCLVLNMYQANYTIKEILNNTGYHSNKSIFLILQRYGIGIKFPNMQRGGHIPERTITQDSHLHTGIDA